MYMKKPTNDSRLKSLSEVGLNIVIGFGINFTINSLLFPHFGIPFDWGVYLSIGGLYTVSSIICLYSLRRFFNRLWEKQNIKGSMLETTFNTIIGFIFTYVAGLLILPYFGMTAVTSITFITLVGLVATMIRRFLFRRMFNHFGPNENLYTLLVRARRYNILHRLFGIYD